MVALSPWQVQDRIAGAMPASPSFARWLRDTWVAIQGAAFTTNSVNNVMTFGAKGDGITDDTVAIQAAIDALGTFGGIVYLPPGTYLISSPLHWGDYVAVRFVGAGMRATMLDWRGGNNSQVIRMDSTTAVLPAGDVIVDMTILNTLHATGMVAIQDNTVLGLTNRNFTTIERVIIEGFATGILFYNGVDAARIIDCWIVNCTNGIVSQTIIAILSELTIAGCTIAGISGWAMDLVVGGACQIGPGNIVLSPMGNGNGIRVDAFNSLTVCSNAIELTDSTGTGLSLGPTTIGTAGLSGASVTANHFNFTSTPAGSKGIVIDRVQGATLLSNTFLSVETAMTVTANAANVFVGQQSFASGITTKLANACTTLTWFDGANVILPNLPAAAAGLPSGALWHDAGAANVVKWVP